MIDPYKIYNCCAVAGGYNYSSIHHQCHGCKKTKFTIMKTSNKYHNTNCLCISVVCIYCKRPGDLIYETKVEFSEAVHYTLKTMNCVSIKI